MRRSRLLIITAFILLTASTIQPNLHGGQYPSKSMALWQLQKYKYTELLRREPLCYCPYKSYLLVDKYVTVENKDNQNVLSINADLIELTKEDADYNKSHAPRYKGTAKEKVRKIYNYCMRKAYVKHIKFARNIFEDGCGDCSAVASAFYVMCKVNGIQVRYCIGWCGNECHAFNRVKIGKTWYYVDASMGRWLWRPLYDGYTVMEEW